MYQCTVQYNLGAHYQFLTHIYFCFKHCITRKHAGHKTDPTTSPRCCPTRYCKSSFSTITNSQTRSKSPSCAAVTYPHVPTRPHVNVDTAPFRPSPHCGTTVLSISPLISLTDVVGSTRVCKMVRSSSPSVLTLPETRRSRVRASSDPLGLFWNAANPSIALPSAVAQAIYPLMTWTHLPLITLPLIRRPTDRSCRLSSGFDFYSCTPTGPASRARKDCAQLDPGARSRRTYNKCVAAVATRALRPVSQHDSEPDRLVINKSDGSISGWYYRSTSHDSLLPCTCVRRATARSIPIFGTW